MTMRASRLFVFGFVAVATGLTLGLSGLVQAQTPSPTTPPGKGAKKMQTAPHIGPTAAPQPAPVPTTGPANDHINFTTKIGSFKMLGSDVKPASGVLDMSFSGTVLISGLTKGSTVTTTGTVKKEYTTMNGTKEVYFGTGSIKVNGTVRALQFFGKNVIGGFKGRAIFRLFGEFDNKLETGFIWYDGQEKDKRPWGTGGQQAVCPNPVAASSDTPVRIHN